MLESASWALESAGWVQVVARGVAARQAAEAVASSAGRSRRLWRLSAAAAGCPSTFCARRQLGMCATLCSRVTCCIRLGAQAHVQLPAGMGHVSTACPAPAPAALSAQGGVVTSLTLLLPQPDFLEALQRPAARPVCDSGLRQHPAPGLSRHPALGDPERPPQPAAAVPGRLACAARARGRASLRSRAMLACNICAESRSGSCTARGSCLQPRLYQSLQRQQTRLCHRGRQTLSQTDCTSASPAAAAQRQLAAAC